MSAQKFTADFGQTVLQSDEDLHLIFDSKVALESDDPAILKDSTVIYYPAYLGHAAACTACVGKSAFVGHQQYGLFNALLPGAAWIGRGIFNFVFPPGESDKPSKLKASLQGVLPDQKWKDACKRVQALQGQGDPYTLGHPDYFRALALYTANEIYGPMNGLLYKQENTHQTEFQVEIFSCVQGLRLLPYYWGICWRGMALSDEDIRAYVKGERVVWHSFTSTSTDQSQALTFAASTGSKRAILFKIHSLAGRSVKPLSFFAQEEEILFRPLTVFKVLQKSNSSLQGVDFEVEMQELYADPRSRKVVLWVDDRPPNNKRVMELSERKRVVIVVQRTTQDAIEFIKEHSYLMQRPVHIAHAGTIQSVHKTEEIGDEGFRIITNIGRTEEGVRNDRAGFDLVNEMRSLGYNQEIGVFCSPQNPCISEAQQMPNISIFVGNREAVRFASFGEGTTFAESDPAISENKCAVM
jgi:hypothetical protein